jgi:heptosyltransferase-2
MKILIIGPSWVGDMVMAQGLFRCLLELHPQARIDVLAPAWTRELLARMPEVNRALDLPLAHGELGLRKRWRLGKALRAEHYEQAIVLPNSFKSALLPLFAKIPRRTGWRGEARGWLLNDCRVLDKQTYPLMLERFVALAYAAGEVLPKILPKPALKVEETHLPALLESLALNTQRAPVVFCPGAEFGPAKQWPETHFAEVADVLISAGKQVWVMGSARDADIAGRILEAVDAENRQYCINLAGRTSIGEAIDLMSLAEQVLSNDSGLMHIAAALGRKLVVIYGSTSSKFTPPLSDDVRVLSLGLDCSPCFKRECPLGHLDCLKKLQASMVIDTMMH